MTNSLQDTINLAVQGFVVAGVAVMATRAIGEEHRNFAASLPQTKEEEHHSIPWKAKKLLIDRYGEWAVNRAESFCPHNDVACVEREARRSFETYHRRR